MKVEQRQIDATGRAWAAASDRQCRVLMHLGDGYWDAYQDNFAMLKWDDLGPELQKRIAGELAKLCELLKSSGVR